MAQTLVKNSDFLVHKPLPWNVYDTQGCLLYSKGSEIDMHVKEKLIKRGALRDIDTEVAKLSVTLPDYTKTDGNDKMQSTKISLTETAIRTGDAIHIDRISDKSHTLAQFVGYMKNKCIIISVPEDEQGHLFLKDGEAIVIKVFSGKHVLVFPATVISSNLKPHPHMYISYPQEVTGYTVRKAERAHTRIVVAKDKGKEQSSGIITDISTGGLSFVTRNSDLTTNTDIVLNFKLQMADSHFLLRLPCTIKSNRGQQNDILQGATAYGVQFNHVTPEDMLIIALFVQQKLAETRQNQGTSGS